MKAIAHRMFRDGARFDIVDRGRVEGFDGVELDLRLDARGRLVVDHAPVFRRRGARLTPIDNTFDAAMSVLGALPQPPGLLLLDVKCVTAAAAAARRATPEAVGAEVVFACWHPDEAAAIRAAQPGATILYCVAPIVAGRAPQGRLQNLFLANSFPFFWSADNFAPKLGKANRHNINIRLISRRRGLPALPAEVDGLCVHRVFWRPSLARLVAQAGLKAAVYGLGSRAEATALAVDRGLFAYAIIGERRGAARTAATQSRLLSA